MDADLYVFVPLILSLRGDTFIIFCKRQTLGYTLLEIPPRDLICKGQNLCLEKFWFPQEWEVGGGVPSAVSSILLNNSLFLSSCLMDFENGSSLP